MEEKELVLEEKSLWRNRDYLLLWSGQAISSFGSQASRIIFPLLILDITHSPAKAGLVGAFSTLPYVLLSLFVGTMADRVNRKKMMLVCEIGRAAIYVSIVLAIFFNIISVIQIYIVALLEGIFFVFFDIAEIASLKRIVGKKTSAAFAQENVTDGFASLFGPSIGTILYQIGKLLPFCLDMLSYFVSIFTLLMIKTEFQEERTEKNSHIVQQLKEGVSWLFNHKILRTMALINSASAFIFSNFMLILIVILKGQHASTVLIGTIVSLSAIGSIFGAAIGNSVKKYASPGQVVIGAGWANAILLPLLIFFPNVVVIAVVTATLFCINSIWSIVQVSFRLSLVPDELQGRVNSVHRFLVYSIIPLGMALTGLILQAFGSKTTLAILFFGLLIVALASSFSKDLRNSRLVKI